MPERIQRKRTKGWRMPEGAVYVGRPSEWGNPFNVAHCDAPHWSPRHWHVFATDDKGYWLSTHATKCEAIEHAVDRFRLLMGSKGARVIDAVISELAGKDLVCWCPLDQPCHADLLLKIANKIYGVPILRKDCSG